MALIDKVQNENIPVHEYKEFLVQARENFLSEVIKALPESLKEVKAKRSFKILKRLEFKIPKDNIPEKFIKYLKKDKENFSELVNQMATVESMTFALEEWKDFFVQCAHPTHTSADQNFDHDLILVKNGEKDKYIEISDVIAAKDSNKKFNKDVAILLKSFKKMKLTKREAEYFIVTSTTLWENYQKDDKLNNSKYTYDLWRNNEDEIFFRDYNNSRSKEPYKLNIIEIKNDIEAKTCILQITFTEDK